jgi:hypothetical protein
MSKTKKHRKNPQKRTRASGWSTSDADEIERRRLRGINEAIHIESLTPDDAFFGIYRTHSGSGQAYRVEIRSLAEPINSCDCPDHRINGLGTCKHIEATLYRLQHRRKRAFQKAADRGSPTIEIFLDRRDQQIRIHWPQGSRGRSRARDLLTPFFALERAIKAAHGSVRRRIRVSGELHAWLEKLDRQAQQLRSRQHFETEVAAGKASLDLLKHPLYPYQQEGMLHLAFTGRALLADEMGLGKTVQAVAACELLRRTRGIRRVLVISPASLKGEWEEQIAKFTDLPSHIIQGPRAQRLCVLLSCQLRTDPPGSGGDQRHPGTGCHHSGRGPAHQELADQDRQLGQAAEQRLRLCTDRHTGREPHRRDLLHYPVPGPPHLRPPVPLQSTATSIYWTRKAVLSATRTSINCMKGCKP